MQHPILAYNIRVYHISTSMFYMNNTMIQNLSIISAEEMEGCEWTDHIYVP